MSVVSTSQMDSFQTFLGEQKSRGIVFATPEESVEAFRKYEQELAALKTLLEPALQQSARGEYVPFDLESVKARMFQKAADKGAAK
jgi:hypothetical protein